MNKWHYDSVVNWLYAQLANYQKQGGTAYKPGLFNIELLLTKLGQPHHQFKGIHIAGTNGKGSTAHILTSICIENGYKVGLFTSPHIKDFRERIKINGQPISKNQVIDFVRTNNQLITEISPSFFEITAAMAFDIFAQEACDIVIIETGLGGRLDATNVLQPEVSVITNIGLDHTQFLGNTIAEIAQEKAGIIKKNTPIVIGEMTVETKPIFLEKAQNLHALLTLVKQKTFQTDLLGQFQQANCSTAWQTIQTLKEKGWFFDDLKSQFALQRVKKNTEFQGRLEIIGENPSIILDAAHNALGIKSLFEEIKYLKFNRLHCIFGTSNDKNYMESAHLFPKNAKYYFTTFDSDRALSEVQLEKLGKDCSLNFSTFKQPNKALTAAKKASKSDDLILVFGSFFILEKII